MQCTTKTITFSLPPAMAVQVRADQEQGTGGDPDA